MPIDSPRGARNKNREEEEEEEGSSPRNSSVTHNEREGERKSSRLIASRQRKAIAVANGKSRRRGDIGRREEGPRPFIRFTVEQIRTYV